mmetsp:Transcript_72258/g.200434  ORF Transcript_72258/g.200434 Transcript_72258/m.200434 type:complete len:211 (-) Transcript_72258:21-653(-)
MRRYRSDRFRQPRDEFALLLVRVGLSEMEELPGHCVSAARRVQEELVVDAVRVGVRGAAVFDEEAQVCSVERHKVLHHERAVQRVQGQRLRDVRAPPQECLRLRAPRVSLLWVQVCLATVPLRLRLWHLHANGTLLLELRRGGEAAEHGVEQLRRRHSMGPRLRPSSSEAFQFGQIWVGGADRLSLHGLSSAMVGAEHASLARLRPKHEL